MDSDSTAATIALATPVYSWQKDVDGMKEELVMIKKGQQENRQTLNELKDMMARIKMTNADSLDKLRDYVDWLTESNNMDNIEYEDETKADSKKE